MQDSAALSPEEKIGQLQKELGWSYDQARRSVEADFTCEYCDCDLLHNERNYDAWQVDYIVPLGRGGTHDFENMALCCKTCIFFKREHAPDGSTRKERVADVREYLKARWSRKRAELEKVRAIVGRPLRGSANTTDKSCP